MTDRMLRSVPDTSDAPPASVPPVGSNNDGEGGRPRPTDAPPRHDIDDSNDTDTIAEPLLRTMIGDALRRVRREQDRTLREVAEEAQVSLPYLSEVERGRKEPSSEVLAAVTRALGMTLGDLTGMLHVDLTSATVTRIGVARPHTTGGISGGRQTMALAA